MENKENNGKNNNSVNLNKIKKINNEGIDNTIISHLNIQFYKNIFESSYNDDFSCSYANTFIVFESIDNILLLIYPNKEKSIILYDLNNFQIISEIKNAHIINISQIRHYLDKKNKIDYIISVSAYENNIKLWNIKNGTCIHNFLNINKKGILYSACFLNNNNNNYILTSNINFLSNIDPIKVFDFNGNQIKIIENTRENTYFIENYYDENLSKNFIIICTNETIKSYDYNSNKIYQNYYKKDNGKLITDIIINKENDIIKLIESDNYGFISIFNFHSGLLLNKINVNKNGLLTICLWNNEYLFVGCKDNSIKLIDLKEGNIVKNLIAHKNWVITIKKINHRKFGECLISQGIHYDQIKLWINNNKN